MEDYNGTTAKHFAPVLRQYRTLSGLSQDDVAQEIGVSKTFYSKMESGAKHPNVDMLLKLSMAFHVRPGAILDSLAVHAGIEIPSD